MKLNISELRAEVGRQNMTYAALARKSGINPSTMSRRLKGKTQFTLPEIWGIANALSLSDEKIRDIFFFKKLT